jgi:chromosome segregation ATPase
VAARIERLAVPFIDGLVGSPIGSRAFSRAIAAVERIGDRELQATTQLARGFADRPTRALRELLDEDGSLTRNLRELRRQAEQLSGEKRAANMARQVTNSERRIRSLAAALDADRAALEEDNAAIGQQEQALWREIDALRGHAALAARLDELLDERIETLRATEPDRARALQTEALFAIRRRRRDLVLQLAVASQGYAALRMIEHDNLEVIWAVRSAATTTATAMRVASLAVDALADRQRPAHADLYEAGNAWSEVLSALDVVEERKRATWSELSARQDAAAANP